MYCRATEEHYKAELAHCCIQALFYQTESSSIHIMDISSGYLDGLDFGYDFFGYDDTCEGKSHNFSNLLTLFTHIDKRRYIFFIQSTKLIIILLV